MNTTIRRGGRLALLGLVLPLLPVLAVSGQSANAQPTPDALLSAAPSGADTRLPAPSGAERSRLGSLDLDPDSLRTGQQVTLNLFADTSVVATVLDSSQQEGYDAWYGTIEGGGSFDLVRVGSTTRLRADIGADTFEVVDDGKVARISETNPPADTRTDDTLRVPAAARTGSDTTAPRRSGDASSKRTAAQAPTTGAPTTGAGGSAGLVGSPGDSSAQIDMLVVYTPQTLAAVGTAAAAQSIAAVAVERANRIFRNSQIPTSVRLVATVPTATNENGGHRLILPAVARPGDGLFEDVHDQRRLYKADQVTTLITAPEYCGLGYLDAPTTMAFTTVQWQCARDEMTLAHEFGHNLGAGHDAGASETPTGQPDARGYVYVPGQWRTVMAYPTVCPTCPRIEYFSNPNVAYNGVPTGTAAANNARVITTNLAKGANWVPSQIYPPELAFSGTPVVGNTVNLMAGPWAPGEVLLMHRWTLDGVPVPSSISSTLTITPEMAGHTLSVAVDATALYYPTVTAQGPAAVVAPGNIGLSKVTLRGNPRVGGKVRARAYVSVGVKGAKYSYQWYRNGKKIKGKKARKATYRLIRKDRRKKIHVVVTARATGYATASVKSGKFRVRR